MHRRSGDSLIALILLKGSYKKTPHTFQVSIYCTSGMWGVCYKLKDSNSEKSEIILM